MVGIGTGDDAFHAGARTLREPGLHQGPHRGIPPEDLTSGRPRQGTTRRWVTQPIGYGLSSEPGSSRQGGVGWRRRWADRVPICRPSLRRLARTCLAPTTTGSYTGSSPYRPTTDCCWSSTATARRSRYDCSSSAPRRRRARVSASLPCMRSPRTSSPVWSGCSRGARFLLTQPVATGYHDLPLGRDDLRRTAARAQSVVFPIIRFVGLHPYQVVINSPDRGSLPRPAHGPPGRRATEPPGCRRRRPSRRPTSTR